VAGYARPVRRRNRNPYARRDRGGPGRRAATSVRTLVAGVLVLLAFHLPARASGAVAVDDGATLGMRTISGFGDLSRLTEIERWLDRPVRWTVHYADRASPADMRASVFAQFRSPRAPLPTVAGRLDMILTVPLAFGSANATTDAGRETIRALLTETAAGAWDDDYAAVARNLVAGGFGDAVVRLGHEMTGTWYPWSAVDNGDAYVAAFRHVRTVMHRVAPGLRFEWTTARVGFDEHARAAYPGDDVVDVIGLDLYHDPDRPTVLDDALWERRYGRVLRAHRDFAVERGKPIAYAEWANTSVDEPEFIRRMYEWFASLPTTGPGRLLVQAYFNAGSTSFDLDGYPRSRATFRELFGAGPDAAPLDTPTGTALTKTFRRDGRPGGTVTFAGVENQGATTVRPLRRGDDDWVEPAGFYLSRTEPVVVAVSTTATIAGTVTVCVTVPPGSLPAGRRPQLLQFGASRAWTPITGATAQPGGRVCGAAAIPALVAVGTGFDIRPVTDGNRSVEATGGETATVVVRADDADGDDVTFVTSRAEHGTVTVGDVSCDGDHPRRCTATLRYRPDPGWSGADRFTYVAGDGATVSDPAAVSVVVFAPAIPAGDEAIVGDPADAGLSLLRAASRS